MKRTLLSGGMIFMDGVFVRRDIAICGDIINEIAPELEPTEKDSVIDCTGKYIVSGFADVHVHFREPGFSYKETIASGAKAAARGGYTLVMTMPNLSPAPDSMENLQVQLDIIRRDACIRVLPYGCITVGEKGERLADIKAMAQHVVGFSDDGKGVQNEELMREAMLLAKAMGKPIVAHCEDESLLRGGYIHDGEYARKHGHKGICSESEWGPIERDIQLIKETGCAYHVCHVSTKESVELIRNAKAQGLPITCETAPHYLTLCDEDLQEDGRFKMNPPLRSRADMEALLEGIIDGTIDCIATDHAPHAEEEKSKGLAGSVMGVVGLETAFAVMYTRLVLENKLSFERLMELMITAPRRIFGIKGGEIKAGAIADIAVLDTQTEYTIEPDKFLTKGRSTPYAGERVRGRSVLTMSKGVVVWSENDA